MTDGRKTHRTPLLYGPDAGPRGRRRRRPQGGAVVDLGDLVAGSHVVPGQRPAHPRANGRERPAWGRGGEMSSRDV